MERKIALLVFINIWQHKPFGKMQLYDSTYCYKLLFWNMETG